MYAIFNPATGTHSFVETLDEATTEALQVVLEFFLQHSHGSVIQEVEVSPDGSVKWSSPTTEQNMRFISLLKEAGLHELNRKIPITHFGDPRA